MARRYHVGLCAFFFFLKCFASFLPRPYVKKVLHVLLNIHLPLPDLQGKGESTETGLFSCFDVLTVSSLLRSVTAQCQSPDE